MEIISTTKRDNYCCGQVYIATLLARLVKYTNIA